jgi:hypothetical protein
MEWGERRKDKGVETGTMGNSRSFAIKGRRENVRVIQNEYRINKGNFIGKYYNRFASLWKWFYKKKEIYKLALGEEKIKTLWKGEWVDSRTQVERVNFGRKGVVFSFVKGEEVNIWNRHQISWFFYGK